MAFSRASVQSSFYGNNNGELVRSYEIKNPDKHKLRKNNLTDLRPENFPRDALNSLIDFFTGERTTFRGTKRRVSSVAHEDDSIKFQHLGSLIPSYKPDGTQIIVDAMNLSGGDDKGKQQALRDFVRLQALNNYKNESYELDRSEYTNRWLKTSMSPKTKRRNSNSQLFDNQYKKTQPKWYENDKKRSNFKCNCVECKSNRRFGLDTHQCDCLDCRQFKI